MTSSGPDDGPTLIIGKAGDDGNGRILNLDSGKTAGVTKGGPGYDTFTVNQSDLDRGVVIRMRRHPRRRLNMLKRLAALAVSAVAALALAMPAQADHGVSFDADDYIVTLWDDNLLENCTGQQCIDVYFNDNDNWSANAGDGVEAAVEEWNTIGSDMEFVVNTAEAQDVDVDGTRDTNCNQIPDGAVVVTKQEADPASGAHASMCFTVGGEFRAAHVELGWDSDGGAGTEDDNCPTNVALAEYYSGRNDLVSEDQCTSAYFGSAVPEPAGEWGVRGDATHEFGHVLGFYPAYEVGGLDYTGLPVDADHWDNRPETLGICYEQDDLTVGQFGTMCTIGWYNAAGDDQQTNRKISLSTHDIQVILAVYPD